jgi:hypothetical protein
VEAGSNTSTVTLRVVGGDEKRSLKSERVKYGRESQWTRTRKRLRWQGSAAYTKEDPSSRQRGRPTKTNRNCQTVIKYLVISPNYWLTDWPSVAMWLWFWLWQEEIVGSEPPFREYLSPEAKEQPLLVAVARKRLVKTLQAGKDLAWFVKCGNSNRVIIICSYDL